MSQKISDIIPAGHEFWRDSSYKINIIQKTISFYKGLKSQIFAPIPRDNYNKGVAQRFVGLFCTLNQQVKFFIPNQCANGEDNFSIFDLFFKSKQCRGCDNLRHGINSIRYDGDVGFMG